MPKVFVLIEAELPTHMDDEDFACYVKDSVRACVGGYHPNDPVFVLDRKSVEAYTIKEEKSNDLKTLKTLIRADSSISLIKLGIGAYGE
jgi:hypothetical protein